VNGLGLGFGMRLPKRLRRRVAEQQRVDLFLAAIRATTVREPVPAPRPATRPQPVAVVRVETPSGPVWQLDEASRARLVKP
jgi:hypothetical protein